MTNESIPVPVTPFQLKLKDFCVWIETKFERRLSRFGFALRMAIAAAVFYAIFHLQKTWLADAPGALRFASWLLFGWAAFWTILEIVRRFHDLGRTGGLFWALAIPYWGIWKVSGLFHLADKFPELWWPWVAMLALCYWPIWLTLQLFFRNGTEGPNGYDGREFYQDLDRSR